VSGPSREDGAMPAEPDAQEIERWHRWMAIDLFNRT
jgi:hypothetical protein